MWCESAREVIGNKKAPVQKKSVLIVRLVVVDVQKKVALIVGLMAGKGGCKAEELCWMFRKHDIYGGHRLRRLKEKNQNKTGVSYLLCRLIVAERALDSLSSHLNHNFS